MIELERRVRTGEFYTPLEIARLASNYLERAFGSDFFCSDRLRLWDMSCGTGNLERSLPSEFLGRCYLSTLLERDADRCRELFPSATIFRYDFLNDDEKNLPPKLRAELDDHSLEWIVLINPPYATANSLDGLNKVSVSMTRVREEMKSAGLCEVSRELFVQFLYRIDRMFRDRRASLGLFSPPKYLTAPLDRKMRERFFDYRYAGGFLFSSKAFRGTSGRFAVGFLMWRLDEHIPLSEQTIEADVLDGRLEKVGVKEIRSEPREKFLSGWLDRPRATKKFPPFANALMIARANKERRDRIAEGFLGSLMSKGNDFANQNYVALFSGPYASAGALSIVESNFERAMIVHAVRRIPRANWLNDKDQFLRPSTPLPEEFVSDCVVWSLFAPSNCTASLVDVEYEGRLWRVKNNFYPFLSEEIFPRASSLPDLFFDGERFAARWLHKHSLSAEAKKILFEAKKIYRLFHEKRDRLDREKFLIGEWDAGWYQIRRSLEDAGLFEGERLKEAFDRLSGKLLPQIYSLGFLRAEFRPLD